jgi:hypothetical protein
MARKKPDISLWQSGGCLLPSKGVAFLSKDTLEVRDLVTHFARKD